MNKLLMMALVAIYSLGILACSVEPEVRTVEVTREVQVAQEIPVTVEVTREVPMVQEVPVTVETAKTVEVTREVQTMQTVEVTREIPVTRIVVATPSPGTNGTVPEQSAPTPIPTLTPAQKATPSPSNKSPFEGWQMKETYFGDWSLVMFQNHAVAYETVPESPVLTYQCDTRGNRAMHIDWHYPIATSGATFGPSSPDPFEEYRPNDYVAALFFYADRLIDFTNEQSLDHYEQTQLDEVWRTVRKQWLPQSDASLTPDELFTKAQKLVYGWPSFGQAVITLDFFEETTDPAKQGPYGPPVLETVSSHWMIVNHVSRIDTGALGELRPAYRRSFQPEFLVANTLPMMTATVQEPEQPATVVAKWDVSTLHKVMAHCEIIRR